MSESKFTGMTYRLAGQFIQLKQGIRLNDEIRRYRTAHPKRSVTQFIDNLVQQKLAIRLKEHPGFVFSLSGW